MVNDLDGIPSMNLEFWLGSILAILNILLIHTKRFVNAWMSFDLFLSVLDQKPMFKLLQANSRDLCRLT